MSSVKAGRQPVLPSPGWGRWPRSGRMRSSPRPAFAACPPASIPRAPGPETPGKSAMHYFQRRAGGSPYCLPPVGGPERPEKSPVDCFQRKAGGSPGRWPRSGRMRSSPPGKVPSPAEETPSSLPILPQAHTRQTTSSVSSLALGSTFPNPGKAYEVFLAAPMTMPQCLKPVRWTVFSERRAAAPDGCDKASG